MITLFFMTHGRKKYLSETIASVESNLLDPDGFITRKVIHSDSPDEDFNKYLHNTYKDYEIIVNHGQHGFGPAIQNMWSNVDTEYVIHWEDDFIMHTPILVKTLKEILDNDSKLAQIALKRQPWNELERRAGGIVESDPESYAEISHCGNVYTTHRKFFTTNPSMYRRKIIALGWPDGPESEGRFGFKLWEKGVMYSAFFGEKHAPPMVIHIGVDRGKGIGY